MNVTRGTGLAVVVAAFAMSLAVPTAALAQAREGIRVRGHWVIEVRQPDGTLVQRREFDNGLTGRGEQWLVGILRRERVPGLWRVALGSSVINDNVCTEPDDVANPRHCVIVEEEDNSAAAGPKFRNLTVGGTSNTIILDGHFRATRDGSIAGVSTALGLCEAAPCTATADPVEPNVVLGSKFTAHDLDAPIAVTTGQIVQVKVTISFQ